MALAAATLASERQSLLGIHVTQLKQFIDQIVAQAESQAHRHGASKPRLKKSSQAGLLRLTWLQKSRLR